MQNLGTPLTRVYRLYRSMGVVRWRYFLALNSLSVSLTESVSHLQRHLPVVNARNEVMGMLTRKELRTDFKVDLF